LRLENWFAKVFAKLPERCADTPALARGTYLKIAMLIGKMLKRRRGSHDLALVQQHDPAQNFQKFMRYRKGN
jgi:hypothetical protein